MMKNSISKIVLVVLLCIPACVLQAQDKYLLVGKGGGYSGAVSVYKIYPHGKVEKGSGIVEINYSQCSKLRKSKAKKIFSRLEKLTTEPYSHPGNSYYFLTYYKSNNELKYTWGSADFQSPEELLSLYNNLVKQLSKLNYSEKNQP